MDPIIPPGRRDAAVASGAWKDRSLLDDFDAALARDPDRAAIIAYRIETGERTSLSYAALDHTVRRMAAGLAGLGIAKGDVASFQLPNWWQFTALHLACLRIGAVTNPLMPIFREREMRFMLGFAESRLLVVPHRFRGFDHAAMARDLRAELPNLEHVLVIGEDDEAGFERVLLERAWERESDIDALFAVRRPGCDEVVQLLYTSGTTGEPKGVMHTPNTLRLAVDTYIGRAGLGGADIPLMASPLAHQTGFMYGMMMAIMLGTTSVLQDIWEPRRAADIIAAERATFSMGATPFLTDLCDVAETRRDDLASLRGFLCGGAPIPSPLVGRAVGAMGARILSGWGMTENGVVTMTAPDDAPQRAAETDGYTLPFMEVKLVDAAGTEVPRGAEGHLLVRSSSNFVGYLKRPRLYTVDVEGWFDSGDLARADATGAIRISGRVKDIVIRGGENIPVVEIEALLFKHKAVRAVAVVGMPNPRLGERICAFVTLRDQKATLDLPDIVAFLGEQRVARQYMPERLIVLDEMPATASGKIQKFRLRELARAMAAD